MNKTATLFCSQASGWKDLDKGTEILKELNKNGFATNHNVQTLQYDSFSCGNFSIVSLLLFPSLGCDLLKTADGIGKNGKNLGSLIGRDGEIDIHTMRKSLFGV